ncbi:MAG: phosphatidylglycerol:prolipoprotein diacylglycerol transferase [Candidatus Peribacteria bacterium]|nr:phosphatidylglycerol:prolipoprotein diacylglycerol transferase [Candidatus Peribacteria bacterium]
MFEAFQFGPILIWTHFLFVLIGLWLSAEFFLRLAQSANLPINHFLEHGVWYCISFLLCGRLAGMIAEYRVYVNDPFRMIIVWDGGFNLLGGAIGIAIVLYFTNLTHRATFLQWLDALVPAASFGLVFDWLGAFFSGQSYGKPTDMFWGVAYDAQNVRYTVPIHPVQLYYAVFFFFLTFLLLIVRKKARRVGTETLVGICLMTIGTFIFESFRGDFGIPVFATKLDFILMIILFVSLGVFAAIELQLSQKSMYIYEGVLVSVIGIYMAMRRHIDIEFYELRFSQLLAVVALLATVVYVIVHRRKYPHL